MNADFIPEGHRKTWRDRQDSFELLTTRSRCGGDDT